MGKAPEAKTASASPQNLGGRAAAEGAGPSATPAGSARRFRPSRAAGVAFLLGLIVTAAFALTSLGLYEHNESHLLRLRAREVGSVLTAVVPSVQTPLASAAELADATGGSPQKFRVFMAPYVGPGRQFASASLWPLRASKLVPTAVLGTAPFLASLPAQAHAFFAHAEKSPRLNVLGILSSAHPSLGFEFATPGVAHGFAVYAENPLPKNRRSSLASNSAFSDLNYALYLGHSQSHGALLVTNVQHFPLTGRHASTVVPFGDSAFTVVVTPNGSLSGTFFANLPWIIAVVGVLVTLAAALMTDRLQRRRVHAEQLAGALDRVATENRRMYTQQRSIAQTLQHALLPDALPQFRGLEVSARYVPAASGIDIGGDWYDIVDAGAGQVLLLIGDVSGHGLPAATTMASLRHAAQAYAAQEYRPATVLAKLSSFVDSTPHSYLETALCALIDVDAHRLTLASAGHLPPLLITGNDGHFVEVDVGAAIGVTSDAQYQETTIGVPPNATLVAFTDGLVERRGEILDIGLARLRDTATSQRLTLEDLVAKLARDLTSEHHRDDTAIVGIQWQN